MEILLHLFLIISRNEEMQFVPWRHGIADGKEKITSVNRNRLEFLRLKEAKYKLNRKIENRPIP